MFSIVDLFSIGDVTPDEVTAEQLRWIDNYHSLGHFGFRHILAQIHAYGQQWKHMGNHIHERLKQCVTCQHWNLGRRMFLPLRSVTALSPWDHIQSDLCTSLGFTKAGYKYCMVIYDVFSGFVILKPLKTKSAEELTEVLFEVFSIMGIPRLVQSDSEAAFISDMSCAFLQKLKALQMAITPYNHRALGGAESMVKLTSTTVRKLLRAHGGEWTEVIPAVTLAVNARVSETRGISPFQLMFNRSPNIFSLFDALPND